MRNVDVYGKRGDLRVFINNEEFKQVLSINPHDGEREASVELAVDGKLTYHGDAKPPVQEEVPMPYDWARDYRTMRERLSTAVNKGVISQEGYDMLTKNLHDI